ncbi:MAG: proline--tRNA ligase [Alphaproteobacteria bacterium]
MENKLRKDDYPVWYQWVVNAAELAENSASPGCMVIKPWGYGIWEQIRNNLDEMIKETGHDNCYFPLFIPLSFFQKEADHVEGFAKEMAVVTHSRLKNEDGKLVADGKLDEPLIVRPTSEAIIADSFSKWIKSYRDLPVMINQWANVVRWEMRPRLFLRTREFLWQEGHTAHSSSDEAVQETLQMLEVYKKLSEEVMAVPVLTGKKPEHEKFPGAVDTYCIESMMQDGKALQAGTSHYLGQTFAKSADIKFVNKENTSEYAYTTSWGVSTRLIGGLIMTHGDDNGLKVPPRVAPHQVIIVPIFKKDEDEVRVMEYINLITSEIKNNKAFDEKIRVKVDNRLKSPMDKYWEWTKKGAPIIIEVGPRDVDGNNVMLKERINFGSKELINRTDFVNGLADRLKNIQDTMFNEAKARLYNNIREDIKTPEEFREYFAKQNVFLEEGSDKNVAFVKGKWCQCPNAEEILKEMKITIRCIPFEQSGSEGVCLLSGKPATLDVIYSRTY